MRLACLGAGREAGDTGHVLASDCCSRSGGGGGDRSGDGGRVDGVIGVDGRAQLGGECLGCGIVGGGAADLFAGRGDGVVVGATQAGYVLGGAALGNCQTRWICGII